MLGGVLLDIQSKDVRPLPTGLDRSVGSTAHNFPSLAHNSAHNSVHKSRSFASSSHETRRIAMKDILEDSTPAQRAFFTKIDNERDKVETFYLTREQEAVALAARLRAQLAELQQHRALYHVRIP
jgi:hypothetical protein